MVPATGIDCGITVFGRDNSGLASVWITQNQMVDHPVGRVCVHDVEVLTAEPLDAPHLEVLVLDCLDELVRAGAYLAGSSLDVVAMESARRCVDSLVVCEEEH